MLLFDQGNPNVYAVHIDILSIAIHIQLSNNFNTFLYYHLFPKTLPNIVRGLSKMPLSLRPILTVIKIKGTDRWSTRANLYTNYYILELA